MTHWTQQQEELRALRNERDELRAEVEAQEARYVDLLRRYDDLRAKHAQQWATIERYQQWAEDVTTSRVR